MLHAAKCYWPGVTQADVEQGAARAAETGLGTGGDGVDYLGSLLFAAYDLVLCLFECPSRAAVIQARDRLSMPCVRLMDSAWLGPGRPIPGRNPVMIKHSAGVITAAILCLHWQPAPTAGRAPAPGSASEPVGRELAGRQINDIWGLSCGP